MNKSSISVHKLMLALFLSSAVFGYVISYGKLYLFHVITLLIILLIIVGKIKIRKSALHTVKFPFIFLLYACLTLIWTPSYLNGIYHIFYLTCAFMILFIINNYVTALKDINFIFTVLSVFFLLNVLVGLVETTGAFRLVNGGSDIINEPLGTRPTGFNFNPNNFGFVFIIIFPFLFGHPNKTIKLFSLITLGWFLIKLESKGFFVSTLSFFAFNYLVKIRKRRTWYKLIAACLAAPIVIVVFDSFIVSDMFSNRSFSAFDQISRGLDLFAYGSIDQNDSTSIRSFMYYNGIQELIKSNGIGLGLSGIGTIMSQKLISFNADADFVSFHNFFLEMLIDLGVVPFLIIMYSYFQIILKNISIARNTSNGKIHYYSNAAAVSLLVAIPASISPSSIVYILPFWIILSFAMSIIKINR